MKRILICVLAGFLLLGCGGKTTAPHGAATPVAVDVAATQTPLSAPPSAAADERNTLSVMFINVGYGDAALICLDGHAMLIDTGAKAAARQVFAAMRHMGVTSLDAVALTHTHADHIGGMEAIGRHMPIAQVYAASISENKKNGENKIAELCDELGLPLTRLDAGDAIGLGALSFEVLGPLVRNAEDDNDNSLVLRLRFGGRTLLFTGDMQFSEEATLLDAGVDLAADILKVGNHGNPDATSDAFGSAVSPGYAVISTSTAEDDDSANARVRAALRGAEMHVTENYPLGVLLRIDAGGTVSISSPETERSEAVISATLDIDAQLLTLANNGASDVAIGGFVVLSERGGECFVFPDGAILPAGESLTLAATGGSGDYCFMAEEKPWNIKKGDTALLYDAGGHLLVAAAG